MIIACSCNNDSFGDGITLESKLAVEGWIEEGDVPQVILSSTIPINDVMINRANDYQYNEFISSFNSIKEVPKVFEE